MTRFLIAKQVGENAYRTIAGLCDGYLEHTGAILLECYNSPEMVDKLLDLGNIRYLDKKLEPDISFPSGTVQKGVTIAFARDYGESNTAATILTLQELDSPGSWNEFIYIFTEMNQWVYFEGGMSEYGLQDLQNSVEREIYPQMQI